MTVIVEIDFMIDEEEMDEEMDEMGEVETLSPIELRYTGRVVDLTKAFDSQNILRTEPVEYNKQYMNTTVGRVILNDVLPEDMPYINGLLKKKGLTS